MKYLFPFAILYFLVSSCNITVTPDHENTDFIGTWKLVKWTAQLPDGKEVFPYGEKAYGKIIYDTKGEMTGILMAEERAKMSSDDVSTRIPEEALAAFNSFFAYAGPYTVHRDSGYVVHHVVACINPNWVGRDQTRYFQFDNGQLVLSTPPIVVQGTDDHAVQQRLTWEKEL